MPFSIFSGRIYSAALICLLVALAATGYRRYVHFDDAWFAEQSYWLLRDGRVRSELFRGYNGWENQLYVFHKLFIYAGAGMMRLLGMSLAASKLLTSLCACLTGWLIWQYARRGSREEQWLAVLLYFGCGTIIRYFCVNRPEIMCMTLGFASYLALDQPAEQRPRSFLAGVLAGLAALTHLNGLIYVVAGGFWLLIRTGWRTTLWFGLAGGLTVSLYALDALLAGQVATLVGQFVHDPATQSNFRLSDKISVMLNYHQLWFHSVYEIPLSVLALLSLLVFRRFVRWSQPIVLYLCLLVITFWLLSKSNFDFYYILFVPWLVLLTVHYLPDYWPTLTLGKQRTGRVLLAGYVAVSIVCVAFVLVENYTRPHVESYNAQLARHMPRHHTRIIAPITFVFGQIDAYQIHGLTYYELLEKRSGPLPLSRFFAQADSSRVEYVVSDGLQNASYVIPLDAPARIGAYTRIFRDDRTSIYAHR
jgi:hypothetical protein